MTSPTDLIRTVDERHVREVIAVHEGGEEAWCPVCSEHWPCEVRRLRDALAVMGACPHCSCSSDGAGRWRCDQCGGDLGSQKVGELRAALAEANATIAALREREETAGHVAESERCRAMEATGDLVEAREAIERVRATCGKALTVKVAGSTEGEAAAAAIATCILRAIEGPAT